MLSPVIMVRMVTVPSQSYNTTAIKTAIMPWKILVRLSLFLLLLSFTQSEPAVPCKQCSCAYRKHHCNRWGDSRSSCSKFKVPGMPWPRSILPSNSELVTFTLLNDSTTTEPARVHPQIQREGKCIYILSCMPKTSYNTFSYDTGGQIY